MSEKLLTFDESMAAGMSELVKVLAPGQKMKGVCGVSGESFSAGDAVLFYPFMIKVDGEGDDTEATFEITLSKVEHLRTAGYRWMKSCAEVDKPHLFAFRAFRGDGYKSAECSEVN